MLSCYDVANYFIWLANEAKEDISNLKLQKLVYYSQGLYLALYKKPLFPEVIQAWELGPVIAPLYYEYKGCFRIKRLQEPELSQFSVDDLDFLNHIHKTLGGLSAKHLSDKTHDEEPWKETPRNHEITQKSMMNFFKPRLGEFHLESADVLAPVRKQVEAACAYEASESSEDLSDFELYLQSKEEWSEVYRRLASS